jgi:hypothetical protein
MIQRQKRPATAPQDSVSGCRDPCCRWDNSANWNFDSPYLVSIPWSSFISISIIVINAWGVQSCLQLPYLAVISNNAISVTWCRFPWDDRAVNLFRSSAWEAGCNNMTCHFTNNCQNELRHPLWHSIGPRSKKHLSNNLWSGEKNKAGLHQPKLKSSIPTCHVSLLIESCLLRANVGGHAEAEVTAAKATAAPTITRGPCASYQRDDVRYRLSLTSSVLAFKPKPLVSPQPMTVATDPKRLGLTHWENLLWWLLTPQLWNETFFCTRFQDRIRQLVHFTSTRRKGNCFLSAPFACWLLPC